MDVLLGVFWHVFNTRPWGGGELRLKTLGFVLKKYVGYQRFLGRPFPEPGEYRDTLHVRSHQHPLLAARP